MYVNELIRFDQKNELIRLYKIILIFHKFCNTSIIKYVIILYLD